MMTVFLAQLTAALLPLVLTAIAAFLARVITDAASVAKARWGIEIEARHREALHSALMSGVEAALGRGLHGSAAISAAVEHARDSVPEALARLQPDAGLLANIAGAKLREAIARAPFVGIDLAKGKVDAK